MTEERPLLNKAGVSLFSVSLDFPDDRHDNFRRLPGLVTKMGEIIPHLIKKYGRRDIVLNSALTHANFAEIPGLVAKAEEWGTQISFSAYSSLFGPEIGASVSLHLMIWRCCALIWTGPSSTSGLPTASSIPTTYSIRLIVSSPKGAWEDVRRVGASW